MHFQLFCHITWYGRKIQKRTRPSPFSPNFTPLLKFSAKTKFSIPDLIFFPSHPILFFFLGSPPLICCDKLDVRSPSGYGDCTGTFRKTSQLGPNGMVMYKQVSDRYSKEGSFLGTNYIYYYETDLCVGPNPSLDCGQDQGLTLFGQKNDNVI